MSDYNPKKGDRVRVVYEGVITSDSTNGNPGFSVEGVPFFENETGLVSVEKIEPPIEVFGTGDVVREKNYGGVFALFVSNGGINWLSLNECAYFPKGWNGRAPRNHFRSDRFERVEPK